MRLPYFDSSTPALLLAPMAGVSEAPFRQICRGMGADVVLSEFLSSEALRRRIKNTLEGAEFEACERPIGIQIYGADPNAMAEATAIITEHYRPEFIDINFGCPVNKVVAKNGGSSLLKDCPLLQSVAAEVAKAVPIPVTAKMRIGWDAQNVNAVEVARILEDSGMQAIAVHGRTRAQGYTGEADWEVIDQVAAAVKIPVIGNGDIHSGADVQRRRAQTRVRGIMIGRAAMTNPWVFQEAKHFLATGEQSKPASIEDRFAFMRRHCVAAIAHDGRGREFEILRSMRNRLMNYTKSIPGGKWLRQHFSQVASLTQLDDILAAYFKHQEELAHVQEELAADGVRLA